MGEGRVHKASHFLFKCLQQLEKVMCIRESEQSCVLESEQSCVLDRVNSCVLESEQSCVLERVNSHVC